MALRGYVDYNRAIVFTNSVVMNSTSCIVDVDGKTIKVSFEQPTEPNKDVDVLYGSTAEATALELGIELPVKGANAILVLDFSSTASEAVAANKVVKYVTHPETKQGCYIDEQNEAYYSANLLAELIGIDTREVTRLQASQSLTNYALKYPQAHTVEGLRSLTTLIKAEDASALIIAYVSSSTLGKGRDKSQAINLLQAIAGAGAKLFAYHIAGYEVKIRKPKPYHRGTLNERNVRTWLMELFSYGNSNYVFEHCVNHPAKDTYRAMDFINLSSPAHHKVYELKAHKITVQDIEDKLSLNKGAYLDVLDQRWGSDTRPLTLTFLSPEDYDLDVQTWLSFQQDEEGWLPADSPYLGANFTGRRVRVKLVTWAWFVGKEVNKVMEAKLRISPLAAKHWYDDFYYDGVLEYFPKPAAKYLALLP